jgi:hypothetical protein
MSEAVRRTAAEMNISSYSLFHKTFLDWLRDVVNFMDWVYATPIRLYRTFIPSYF